MNKKLTFRAAKLSSESQKLKTSSNVSIAYEHRPKDPDERRHGILFGVIDVNGSPKHAEELIELIIDTFHGEYYQNLDKEVLESFENALSKINEELGEFTSNGHTFWMGKLNAILGVYSQNEVHITQAGRAEAYLYRGGKESHISEDLGGDSVNPLRTFVNIASGDIGEGDKIALVSSGVHLSCSREELTEFVTKYHPKLAVNHIANLIEGAGGSYGQNSAILIEFLTPEAMANETLEEEPDEIWLQGTTKKEILAEQTGNVLQKMMKYLKLAALFVSEFYANSLVPWSKKSLEFIKNQIENVKGARDGKKEKPVLMETEEEIAGFEREEVPEIESSDEAPDNETLEKEPESEEAEELEKLQTSPSYKSEIRIKESEESPGKARLQKTKSTVLKNLGNLYGSATKLAKIKTHKKMPKIKWQRKYFLIVAALAILIIIPYGIYSQKSRSGNKVKAAEKAKIESINQKVAEANAFAGQNDKQKANQDLQEAKKMAEELRGSKYFSNEASQKLSEIEGKIASITQTSEASAVMFADLSASQSDLVGTYSIGNNFYAVSKNGTVTMVEKKSKKVSKLQIDGKVEGNVVAATALAKIKVIEILTDKPGVYEFDADDNSITEKKASDGWEKAVDIDSYGTALYLLGSDGIFKHTRTASGYGKKSPYLENPADVTNPLSFKIDSDVYVLSSDGNITKFTSGKKQDFQLKDLPINLNSYNFLYTDTETKNILVASKTDKAVVVIGKDGAYKGRYTSNDFADLNYVSIEGNTVYAVTKNKVLSFEIK